MKYACMYTASHRKVVYCITRTGFYNLQHLTINLIHLIQPPTTQDPLDHYKDSWTDVNAFFLLILDTAVKFKI